MTPRAIFTLMLLAAVLVVSRGALMGEAARTEPAVIDSQSDRSPVDLVLSSDEKWLFTANQTAGSVSMVRLSDGVVTSEVACGKRPSAIALSPDGRQAVVTATYSGELVVLEVADGRLQVAARIALGFEPRGVAISPNGQLAYVALTASNEVVVVDLAARSIVDRIAVGRWPRYLGLSGDGRRLAVGCSGDGGIWVVDTPSRSVAYKSKFLALNLGQVQVSRDGNHAYFPWMVYADRPITPGNIREGWVLGNRIARQRLDGPARREALAIDPRGQAVGDPHGIALSPDEKLLAVAASGTQELVFFALDDLPLRGDGPGDHLQPDIAKNDQRFFRVPLSGRPMGARYDSAGQRVYVANYLDNSVQVVNVGERKLERTISLGGAAEPSLARRGEAIFHDAKRSVDGWYSCHSCHYEGGTNAVTMDTKNDGSFGTYKMVLSLRNLKHTGPWFWHGWQKDASTAVAKSLVDTMQGPAPSDEDTRAVMAYLETVESPPNSHRTADGHLSPQAERGRQVFAGEAAGCATCHPAPYYTDGQVHDVGLGSEFDKYDGYNTPSLVDVGNRAGYLHHGRAKSLDELLVELHSPEKVSGTRALSAEERDDLIAFLKSL